MQLLDHMKNQELHCPICNGTKAKIAGKDVKLSGKFEDKEFLTIPLTVLQCTQCGYYMFFDHSAEFTAKDS